PKAEGNIVQHQLDRLKELWETVAADDSWGNVRVLPQLHTLLYANERGV
ncbi:MAG: 7-carboxy-7-deazaguanine synthase QueE, partial [Streptococcus thermophilus]|nr:7-carboxy-7-deazaguanine synthase QueE [Streptococcus thermophilus]